VFDLLTLGNSTFVFSCRTTYFDEAVNDWNNGDPDVLTLTSSVAGYDPDCKPIEGVMKVCNNDYGDTGWYGINEISAFGKIIVTSVAKMNDFYFPAEASEMPDRRLYTMCHEIGHGEYLLSLCNMMCLRYAVHLLKHTVLFLRTHFDTP
jgi:hypothetical protein